MVLGPFFIAPVERAPVLDATRNKLHAKLTVGTLDEPKEANC